MMKFLWPIVLSGMACNAFAQAGAPDSAPHQGPPTRWGVGVAAVVSDSPYAGEGTRVIPIPLVTYEGERFFFRGTTAGWRLARDDAFEFSALAKLRMDGFDVEDLGRQELAVNGVDDRLLEDRDFGVDLGFGIKWTGAAGELDVELLADASDTSGGQEVSIQYGRPLALGGGRLTPNVGVAWLSEDLANYYYGTLDDEIARGVVDYRPDATIVPHVGFSYVRPIGERWAMLAFARYSRLPDEIRNSPLIEAGTDATTSVFVGFARGF
jgi:outer membrane protein